jgi:hypothetical protein
MTHAQYRKLTLGLLAAWFVFSLTASALHLYVTTPSQPPLPVLLAVLVPVAAFLVWMATSQGFRQFVFSLDPRAVTMVHTWRTAGFTFLLLYTYGILPGLFALPAGWGDIAIGATAPLVALKLADANHRKSFLLWQALGVLDLVVALSTGALISFQAPLGSGLFPMAVLPLSLIPTFAVPLLLILHIICIAQAWSWNESSYPAVRPSLSPAA